MQSWMLLLLICLVRVGALSMPVLPSRCQMRFTPWMCVMT